MSGATCSLVSVVIPAYNAQEHLTDAILSVVGQAYSHIECVVVDDGSTDGTSEILTRIGNIRRVYQENAGVSAARNRGIAESSGALIAFLDADDVWLPEKLAKQVDALNEGDRGVGLVYCGMYETDGSLNVLSERPAPDERSALRNTLLMEPPVVSLSQTGLIPRRVLDEVGGFNTSLTTSADTDMVIRIGMRHGLIAVKEPLVLYRTHPNQMSLNADAMLHDMEIVLDKAFSSPDLPDDLRRLRRRAQANLKLAVGGSRLARGDRAKGASDLLGALTTDPVRSASVLAAGALKRIARRS